MINHNDYWISLDFYSFILVYIVHSFVIKSPKFFMLISISLLIIVIIIIIIFKAMIFVIIWFQLYYEHIACNTWKNQRNLSAQDVYQALVYLELQKMVKVTCFQATAPDAHVVVTAVRV